MEQYRQVKWLLCMLVAALASTAELRAGTFMTIDPPGSSLTIPYGISGEIVVGEFYNPSFTQFGFYFDGSTYTTMLPTVSTYGSVVRSINGTTAAGGFGDDAGGHGFLYDGSSYSIIDVPGADFTQTVVSSGATHAGDFGFVGPFQKGYYFDGSTYFTINPDESRDVNVIGMSGSQVYGTFAYIDGIFNRSKGFVFDEGEYTIIKPDGADGASVTGIWDGLIYGLYNIGGTQHGFVFDGVDYTTLDHPLAGPTGTYLNGIFEGIAFGSYYDTSGFQHGFLYDGNTYSTVDFPGAFDFTTINGMWGTSFVGTYDLSDYSIHGYVYKEAAIPEPTTLLLLTTAIPVLVFAGRRRKMKRGATDCLSTRLAK